MEDPAVGSQDRPESTASSCVTTSKSFTSLSFSFFISEMGNGREIALWTGKHPRCWVSTHGPSAGALRAGGGRRLPLSCPPLARPGPQLFPCHLDWRILSDQLWWSPARVAAHPIVPTVWLWAWHRTGAPAKVMTWSFKELCWDFTPLGDQWWQNKWGTEQVEGRWEKKGSYLSTLQIALMAPSFIETRETAELCLLLAVWTWQFLPLFALWFPLL